MSPEACERWDDKLAGYAVGALSAEGAEALEVHVAGCRRCAARLRWIAPAVDALASTAEPETPSPALRNRVLETVYAEADGDRRRERQARRGARLAAARERLRRRLALPVLRPALVGISVVALLFAGVAGYAIRGGDGERTVAFENAAGAQAAVAELSVRDDDGTLRVTGLPELGVGEVYQAWVGTGDEVQPSSVFVLDRDGEAAVAIPGGLEGAEEVIVTQEPSGGSEQPTGVALLRASLN